jgi:hypothetical protein
MRHIGRALLISACGCAPPGQATLVLEGATSGKFELVSKFGIQRGERGHFVHFGENLELGITIAYTALPGPRDVTLPVLGDAAGAALIERVEWTGDGGRPYRLHGVFEGTAEGAGGQTKVSGAFSVGAEGCFGSTVSPLVCGGHGPNPTGVQEGDWVCFNDRGALSPSMSTVPDAFRAPFFARAEATGIRGRFKGEKLELGGASPIPCVVTNSDRTPPIDYLCGAERTIEHGGCTYDVTVIASPTDFLEISATAKGACSGERFYGSPQLGWFDPDRVRQGMSAASQYEACASP